MLSKEEEHKNAAGDYGGGGGVFSQMASWPLKQKEAELILLLQEVALGAGGTQRQSTATGCSLLILNSCAHTCLLARTLKQDTPSKSETAVSTQGYSPPLRANFTTELCQLPPQCLSH